MALGALIGAYQEDDSGHLRALLQLAGGTLLEYQARCLAVAGASPIVVMVERIPPALAEAFDRLRDEGVVLVPVSNAHEAASRFEAGSMLMLLADGVAPDLGDIEALKEEVDAAIVIVPDDEQYERYERIDASHRWAGLALVEASQVGATAAMLGDWDLQSTLLRRTIQSGARHIASMPGEGRGPYLADSPDGIAEFERRLLVASRGERNDAASRYLLPIVEEFATERLMETGIRPTLLVAASAFLLFAGAFCFTRGWHGPALALILFATPLEQVARRLGTLRLKPLASAMLTRRALWPLAGLALLALGWFESRHGGGWGSFVTAISAAAFGEAGRIERQGREMVGGEWLLSWRNAAWTAPPFAIGGWWNLYLVFLALYATASFFFIQYFRHSMERD